MLRFSEDEHDELLSESREFTKNQHSTFIEQLEEMTQPLLDEVFNSYYAPVYSPKQTKMNEQKYNKVKRKDKYSRMNATTRFETPKIYKNYSSRQLDESFKNFLQRNQSFLNKKSQWVKKQKGKQQQRQLKELKKIPDIERGSKQKKQPIYERCIELQKSKQKKIQSMKIEKNRHAAQQIKQIPFKPQIIRKGKKRTIQEYVNDQRQWQKNKVETLKYKKLADDAKKLMECTFTPHLISRYQKDNPLIIKGQKVEQRLLRSLQKSIDKHDKKY